MSIPQVHLGEQRQKQHFVEKAAKHFEDNPVASTYGKLEPGEWFGLRWGWENDCIVVFKISHDEPIENFVQVIEREASIKYTKKFSEFRDNYDK